jgi:hypothetical protein
MTSDFAATQSELSYGVVGFYDAIIVGTRCAGASLAMHRHDL